MRSEGYGTWSVRLCVCLSVYFTLILELQATKQHVNGTLVFSATSARKIIWPIWLKRLRSRKRNRHCRGPRFKTQPINYRGVHVCLLHAWACACSTDSALGAAQPGVQHCCNNATSGAASLFILYHMAPVAVVVLTSFSLTQFQSHTQIVFAPRVCTLVLFI